MEKIDIILPNRIGDSILTLPAIACLKQLIDTYEPCDRKVKVFSPEAMEKIFQALQLFPVEHINIRTKIKSWLNPSDKAFFLISTSANLGFRAKATYGLMHRRKKLIKYTYNAPYLNFRNLERKLPEELLAFLMDDCGLSVAASRYFGICLDLGYSVEQIKSAFVFNKDSLPFAEEFSSWKPAFQISGYVVICMEAAYNKKREVVRRWSADKFLELAEKIYAESSLFSVFIGVNDKPQIPVKPYLIDLRRKLYIPQLAQLMRYSNAYVGNDTGPHHIANLMKKPSICIVLADNTENYCPIFKDFVHLIRRPQTVEEVMPIFNQIVK